MIIGTAGHIDHGKSSLVRALTGTDPDRLKEEKARGITIELGFAYWKQADGRVIGFVDVPGHERFVHTMLAGAHGIDVVLLVVAADDGVMPQTREHLAIVRLLGRERAVVALTKVDLVDADRVAAVTAEIRALLAPTAMAAASVVPVSVVTGEGMDVLAAALVAEVKGPHATSMRFRLAVDRSFSIAGAGTVVTGTILSGRVAVGDRVVISPSGREARVRGLHRQNQAAAVAVAGDRCALNLAGVGRDEVARGEMVLDPALHAPTRRMDVRVALLEGETKPLGTWMPIRLHHAAAEVLGRVVPLGAPIRPGESGLVQLVLERPIAAAAGDLVVLRDISARRTIGGGAILDVRAPERHRRAPARLAVLAALEGPVDAGLLRRLAACSPYVVDLAGLARDRAVFDFGPWLDAAGLVVIAPGWAMDGGDWAGLQRDVVAVLDAFHQASPNVRGMAIDKLRAAVAPLLPVPALRLVLGAMEGVVAQGAWVRRAGHVARLAPAEEAIWQEILPGLGGDSRFRPPRVRGFAGAMGLDEKRVRAVLKAIVRRGEVEEVAPDHFFLRTTLAEMAAIVVEMGEGEFSAAQFRDRLGAGEHNAGRKVAIQVLEFFDRHGITLRRGDARRVDRRRLVLFLPDFGREASLVGRPDFKSGWGRQPVPGGFDSHSLPPGGSQ